MKNHVEYAKALGIGEVLTILGIIIGLVSAVAIAVWQYNTRYDAEAKAADGIDFSYSSTYNVGAGTITMSAGEVTCGYTQVLGATSSSTKYDVYYKKTSNRSYTKFDTVYLMPGNDEGEYDFKDSWFSQKYDVKAERKNNKTTVSSFRMFFGVY